jgi:hypothetical protein
MLICFKNQFPRALARGNVAPTPGALDQKTALIKSVNLWHQFFSLTL